MMEWLRSMKRWLWAFALGVVFVAASLLEARQRARQARHDGRLKDLQQDQSAERTRQINTEVEAARRAAAAAKKRKEHAEKALDGLSRVDSGMADTLSRYNAERVPKRADPP